MSEYSDQRDAIKALIETVTDVGIVHGYPRYGDAAQHWITEIDGKKQIRAWEIGLQEPGVEVERLTQGHRHRYMNWRIQGYVGLEDEAATYDTITALAEAIAAVIDADETLTGTALGILAPGGTDNAVQISAADALTIGGGALCWGIDLTFSSYNVVT